MALVPFTLEVAGDQVKLAIHQFHFDSVVQDNACYVIPRIDGAHSMVSKGNPDLPCITIDYQLPPQGTASCSVVSADYTDYFNVSVLPSNSQGTRHTSAVDFSTLTETYTTDAFFPGNLVRPELPHISRNLRCQSVHFYPVQYNPVTRHLRVYHKLEILIQIHPEPGLNVLTNADLNIQPFPGSISQPLNAYTYPGLKTGHTQPQQPVMLIICPQDFQESIKPFTAWKNRCGIQTVVRDAGQFADAPGLAQYVRNFYYENGSLLYLLLVGDSEQVPSQMMPYGASDNYYSYIAGTDHYPDIMVGRFSASTADEVALQVKRSLEYEQQPASDRDWFSSVLGIASTMGPGDDGETDYEHLRNLMGELKNSGYHSSAEFFDGSQGGEDKNGDPDTQSILETIRKGAGLILYAGHGSTSSWATGQVTRNQVSTLDNSGYYPVIISAACENGNFAGNSCLAESWLKATNDKGEPAGAVGALMASGSQTSFPPMEGQDAMIKQLCTSMESSSLVSFGTVAVNGLNSMNNRYGESGYILTDTWVLFGDPSLAIRTQLPKELIVSHEDVFGKGRQSFSIQSDIPSGIAVLTDHGVILGVASFENGYATIYLDNPLVADTVILTVTASNHLPYEAVIPVTSIPSLPDDYYPLNHSQRLPISVALSWGDGKGGLPEFFRVYLGTDNPPTNLVNGYETARQSYTPSVPLAYHTKYYWRIEAVNASGCTTGKVFEFETIYGPDEDFEKTMVTDTKWNSGGTTGWFIDTLRVFRGIHSCRSGLLDEGASSSLIYSCFVESCDFTGFWFKLMSENHSGKLFFLVDGVIQKEWNGMMDWNYEVFPIEAGMHELEWRYLQTGPYISGDQGAWLDDISLPLRAPMESGISPAQRVCEGTSYIPEAWAGSFNSVLWETDGDGTFDDPTLLTPAYMPGPSDLEKGTVNLQMNVSGFDHCSMQQHSIHLQTERLPEISLPSDTLAVPGQPMILDASSSLASMYQWLPSNEFSPVIQVEESTGERGLLTLELIVTSASGCSVQKLIKVYFSEESEVPSFNIYPNPCERSFTLEPEHGPARLQSVSLVNTAGQKVWNLEGDIEIITGKEFEIPALSSGTYLLVTEHASGRAVKPLLIR